MAGSPAITLIDSTMKRVAALILVMLFCCGFMPRRGTTGVAPIEPPEDSLAALYNYTDGIRLLMLRGDTTAGVEALNRAVAADTTYSPALYLLSSLHAMNNIGQAKVFAERAYREDTTNKWYASQYGRLLVLDANYAEALDIYLKLLRDHPNEPNNYRMVSLLYQQQHKPFSALVILDSAEVRFGKHPLLSSIKRNLLIGTRQFDKALAEATALVESEPYDIDHHIALGDIYAAMGRDSLAESAFDSALQIDSLNLVAQMALGDLYHSRHNYRQYLESAAAIFRNDRLPAKDKVLQLNKITSDRKFYATNFFQISKLVLILFTKYPDEPQVVEAYANHLIASGEIDKALELYKSRLDTRPPVKHYYDAVIDIESYLKNSDSTAKYVAQALSLFPDDVTLYLREAYSHSAMERYDKAEESFRRALPVAKTDSVKSILWGSIGDLYHAEASRMVNPDNQEHLPDLYTRIEANRGAKKLMRRCFAAYDKALTLFADNASVLNNYAYFLAEQNRDIDRAVEFSRRATELSRNNPTYLDTYAWALYKANRAEEAKPIMQQALSLDADSSAELLIHYGDILSAMGEQFMAQIYWRRALEAGYPADAIERRLTKKSNTDQQ